jgi:hypothetical protein
MTDRVKGFVVTLEKDIRIDDVEPLMQAIRYLRGVGDVSPSISDSNDHINQMRIKNELREKMWHFIKENM